MQLWNKIKSVFAASRETETPAPQILLPASAKHTRTEAEKAWISEFKEAHSTLIENLENAVYDSNMRMKKAEDPAAKANLCRKTIQAYEKLQKVCRNTGQGGVLYFEDMWEHCSNSSNPDFRFIDPVEEILRHLTSDEA